MSSLEQSIAEWRKNMTGASTVEPETLDELENHLRETVEQLVRSGMVEAEAFQRAVDQLGTPLKVASEFQKLDALSWLPARVVTALAGAAALTLALFMFGTGRGRHPDLLLATHVFTLTMGYTTTLLMGLLGICFVAQRAVSAFSPRRLSSLARISWHFAWLAFGFTATGIVLGMLWSQREWGQYWGWDAKEMGGLNVVVWQFCFLAAHHWRRATARLLIFSLLGSNTVALAWFGPPLVATGLHAYGVPAYTQFLVAVVVANLVFFAIGLAPASWLRLRRTSSPDL